MNYVLKSNGDYWEKRFHDRLSPLFPNYESFWQKVVVPSTMRDSNKDPSLCEGLDRDFELLVMSHYSAYFHFGVALELLESADQNYYLYDDFFFHVDAGVKMTERFLRHCMKLWRKVEGLKAQNIDTVLSVEWAQKKSEFDALKNEPRVYRDAIAHDPRLGMKIMKNKLHVPIYSKLLNSNGGRATLTWCEVKSLSPETDFIGLKDVAIHLVQGVLSSVDALWPEIIEKFNHLASLDSYQKLARTGRYYPATPAKPPLYPNVVEIRSVSSSASGILYSDDSRRVG